MGQALPNPLSVSYLQGVLEQRPLKEAIRRNYIGKTLLPAKNVSQYDLSWDVIRAENGLAGIYAMNGRPVPGSDILFSQMFATVQNIMAMRVIDPYTALTMRQPGDVSVQSMADEMAYDAALREAVRKLALCDDSIDTTEEYLIMQAFQGSITWPPRDASGNSITTKAPEWGEGDFTITFPLRATFQQNATTLSGYDGRLGERKAWTDPASNPMKDMEVISELIWRTTGLNPRGSKIIGTQSVLSYMALNTNIQAAFLPAGMGRTLNIPELKSWLATNLGFEFVEYDAMWTYRTNLSSASGPTINSVPFLPVGKLLILPPGENFGSFGVAPTVGDDSVLRYGKRVWKYTDPEPPHETRLGIQEAGFPLITAIDSVFVLDAFH